MIFALYTVKDNPLIMIIIVNLEINSSGIVGILNFEGTILCFACQLSRKIREWHLSLSL